jgi:hypothetical protein
VVIAESVSSVGVLCLEKGGDKVGRSSIPIMQFGFETVGDLTRYI